MTRFARSIHLDIERAPRNGAAFSRRKHAGVLNCVLKEKKNARAGAGVALVNEHGSAFEQIAMPFKRQIKDSVEQRVAGANEGSQRLAGGSDEVFLECNTLITSQHRFGG